MAVVAITGVSGGLGAQLTAQLDCDPDVDAIIGIDAVAPTSALPARVEVVRRGPGEPYDDVFADRKVDVAIHLAWSTDPVVGRDLNMGGTRAFLSACRASPVRIVSVLSSAAAYGARADNPDFLYEGAPLRADERLPWAVDHMRAEDLCYDFARERGDVCLQIVRPCLIVGPSTTNPLTRMLGGRFVLAPLGYDPVFQLVHEDDATRAIHRLIKLERVGVFNLGADGYLSLPQMARLAEKRVIRLPIPLLRLAALAGLGWPREVARGFVDYCLHPWLLASIKVKTDGAFAFRYDTPRAFLDWLEASAERRRGVIAPKVEEPEELDEDELEDLPASFKARLAASTAAAMAAGDDAPTPRVGHDRSRRPVVLTAPPGVPAPATPPPAPQDPAPGATPGDPVPPSAPAAGAGPLEPLAAAAAPPSAGETAPAPAAPTSVVDATPAPADGASPPAG